ncbi:MAG: polysaccharide biosynthesis/export family protein [Bacteroidota bacterium]
MKNTFFILTLLLLAGLSSCIHNRDTVYFQNLAALKESPQLYKNQDAEYRLQEGDILSIRIKGLTSEKTAYLNKQSDNDFNNYNTPGLYVNGFSVDSEGKIMLPNIGEVSASGKTVDEVRREIQDMVSQEINNASVFITLVSFKISVLGEVTNPGYFYAYNDQLTLMEGLALAGDLMEFADRRNIRLVRQVPSGSEVVTLDLTDANIFSSKYFYLQPNDAIYIPPMELKNKRSNLANTAIAGVILTALGTAASITAIVISLSDNNSN